MRRAIVLTSAPVLLLLACERTTPARVDAPVDIARSEVSFRLAGPNEAALVVPVHVNGHGPYDFILDTGATLTCIEEELAQEIGLEPAAGVAVGTSIGAAGRMRLVRIDSLRVGQTTGHGLIGCALDLQRLQQLPGLRIEGLLGLNFLKSFQLTLDFGRKILRFEEQ